MGNITKLLPDNKYTRRENLVITKNRKHRPLGEEKLFPKPCPRHSGLKYTRISSTAPI